MATKPRCCPWATRTKPTGHQAKWPCSKGCKPESIHHLPFINYHSNKVQIQIPELSLIALVGPSGAGKSSFAKRHFLPTEVVSSDYCRALVSDDELNQSVSSEAFDLLHYIIAKRLKLGKLAVVDATNVQAEARKSLIALAKEHHVLPVAIVLDLPLRTCIDRNAARTDRNISGKVIQHQHREMRGIIARLKKEGFRQIFVLRNAEEVEAVAVSRTKMWNDKKHESGPFDIIGDVHGCFLELKELLGKLGYKVTKHKERNLFDKHFGYSVTPPIGSNRKVVFVGDFVDRGPASNEVLRLVMSMAKQGTAICVPGNHDDKLNRKIGGSDVQMRHGLEQTWQQLATEPPEFLKEVRKFLEALISHYVFDNGRLVVAHAGLREEMQGRASAEVRSFCLYGETTGEADEFGLPVRYNWAKEYRGRAVVVYGHTPVLQPEWLNNTIDIDTGCVFGGQLTALRYPERELVSVPAKEVYYEPTRPFEAQAPLLSLQQENDDLLHLEDVLGKRHISTRLIKNVLIREENATAALEVMSRFAINPKWLVYLPPTMSPGETSVQPDHLERPEEVFDYFKKIGIRQVICEEKHMGSRAVVAICKDEAAALGRFGVQNEGIGKVWTRTGRSFFPEDNALESAFLQRFCKALSNADFWEKHQTEWALFDCELMPWSAKAQGLITNQYAAVGASAKAALPAVLSAMKAAEARGVEMNGFVNSYGERLAMAGQFVESYRRYCWEVASLDDYRLAPFHLLATEDKAHFDKNHVWHMEEIHAICNQDPGFLLATPYRLVDFEAPETVTAAIEWWEALTANGGEGMVVKPLDFIANRESEKLVQPALKCRGREYLRIIYGPEYTLPRNLSLLKKRSLGQKRSMASREFALGVEALERFVQKEPLRRVHECVFGVLAMETEGVDPRL
ncbi:MAG: polynucleotide kinase-phosphatase [Saprospiraceae bacterium]|nr:polynucleotide kinase-phosphatase [Saprospiraceae bacterium]